MKIIYILCGIICLGLGILGVILPGLPATPFLLATLYFFSKSSPRLHHWFTQTGLYRNHLQSFSEQRALSKKAKTYILTIATTVLLIGFYFTPGVIGKSLIAAVLLIKYWVFLYWIKTVRE
ncbi:hypothetical protein EDC45_1543 [Mesocricetibacter intestinalis]|uniref:Inner membrane protein n=1 Tax=Mesocricetibacter intestinalis TaxID=1521930 RepID=A0A4R6VAH0_9PAST|nr:YbaN family protein [Mesocricetibacter intestinalis]TDQ57150.1 hypothetical protein EDC45_1543 [Mesocricetibacter intestinalis]